MARNWATSISTRVTSYRSEWLSRDIIAGLSVAAVALRPWPTRRSLGSPRGRHLRGDFSAACLRARRHVKATDRESRLRVLRDSGGDAGTALGSRHGALRGSGRRARAAGRWAMHRGRNRAARRHCQLFSRPILTGYMNGIALSIIAGQLEPLLGLRPKPADSSVSCSRSVRASARPTFRPWRSGSAIRVAVRAKTLGAAIRARSSRAWLRSWPSPLGLDAMGVALVGALPAGFPARRCPTWRSAISARCCSARAAWRSSRTGA